MEWRCPSKPLEIGVDGEAAVGVAADVIDVADRRLTEGVAAFPVPPHDQLPEVAVEAAAMRISTGQRPADRRGVEPAPPQPALLVARMSRARPAGGGP